MTRSVSFKDKSLSLISGIAWRRLSRRRTGKSNSSVLTLTTSGSFGSGLLGGNGGRKQQHEQQTRDQSSGARAHIYNSQG